MGSAWHLFIPGKPTLYTFKWGIIDHTTVNTCRDVLIKMQYGNRRLARLITQYRDIFISLYCVISLANFCLLFNLLLIRSSSARGSGTFILLRWSLQKLTSYAIWSILSIFAVQRWDKSTLYSPSRTSLTALSSPSRVHR